MNRLPRVFKGTPVNPSLLSDSERQMIGLSTYDTIVEVIGDNEKLREMADRAREKGWTGFDTETTDKDPHTAKLVLVQMGDLERQYVIWYNTIDQVGRDIISDILADKEICKIGQQLEYDLIIWLWHEGVTKRAWNIADSMIVEQVLGCGIFGGGDEGDVGLTLKMTRMEALAARWLGLDIEKDEELRTGWEDYEPGTLPKEKLYYAADDVCIPRLVLMKQKPWILELELKETIQIEHNFTPVLAEMEYRGLKIAIEDREDAALAEQLRGAGFELHTDTVPGWESLCKEAQENVRYAKPVLDKLFDVETDIRISEDGQEIEITRDKLYTSPEQLKDMIHDWMLEHYGVYVVITNRHFYNALVAGGSISEARLDKMFEKGMIDNPKKAGKKKRVGYPAMNDLVEKFWEEYKEYCVPGTFMLPDTESKTLKLFKIIFETTESDRHPELPTSFGLPPELIDPILKLRLNEKRQGTYGRNWYKLINPKTGRIHASFIQAALSTGRLSSTPNVQNLPVDPRYRGCFVPEKGYKYVGGDWSQIEPRVIAQISEDPTYMRVFWSEYPGTLGYEMWCGDSISEVLDLYTEIGKNVGLIPVSFTIKDVKGKDASPEGLKGRKQAKIIVLGLGYGTGIAKFWLTLIVDTGEHHTKEYAAHLFNTFWESVQTMKGTLDRFSALASPKNSWRKVYHPIADCQVTYSETLGGRKRFFRPDNPVWWTTGRNHPIQGTAGGDIQKRSAIMLARWLWKNEIDGGLVNLIHDEMLLEVREDQAKVVLEAMQHFMERGGEYYCTKVPTPASGYIADFWQKD